MDVPVLVTIAGCLKLRRIVDAQAVARQKCECLQLRCWCTVFLLRRPLQVTFSLMASAGSIPSSAALDSLLCAGSSDQSVIVFAVEPVPIIVVAGRSRRAFNGRLHGLVSLSILSVIIWSEFIHPI